MCVAGPSAFPLVPTESALIKKIRIKLNVCTAYNDNISFKRINRQEFYAFCVKKSHLTIPYALYESKLEILVVRQEFGYPHPCGNIQCCPSFI